MEGAPSGGGWPACGCVRQLGFQEKGSPSNRHNVPPYIQHSRNPLPLVELMVAVPVLDSLIERLGQLGCSDLISTQVNWDGAAQICHVPKMYLPAGSCSRQTLLRNLQNSIVAAGSAGDCSPEVRGEFGGSSAVGAGDGNT